MQPVFSTDNLHPKSSFKIWRETLFERLVPIEIERLDDSPFAGKMEFANVGTLRMTRVTQGALRNETTPNAARHHDRAGMAVVLFKLSGRSTCLQDGRDSVQKPGDIVVLDHRPSVVTTSPGSQAVFLELPRERLESMLGSTRLYTALSMGAEMASTSLASTFFRELIQVRHRLDPDSAERMSTIGLDLIVACIAERMAQEVPQPLHGTVVVQRAKAFVEANLGDPTLDPPQLAAAVGVSLRRLQELFHERGQHISDWIWQRRLVAAAKRLADPSCAHLQIGAVAFGCGFASQAHFARRFKERHGLSPREYRVAALLDTAERPDDPTRRR
ncbi:MULTISPECIES: helix-turn-helix domain-containing protein [Methylobacterium]|uniref:helix-turn-helix domain-containing protein n=1 Tax=Methylobacterium TaxID=407 RepID=UPI0011C877CE|nr:MULTISPECIES: helix-turn-helix domain-containing protein [Methylobacterium]TXN45495.1 helix-turn-helix domain-containing protein [Methylobacterium sp. WL7]TXN73837.1 helix-turn-helix domain-containing protein [Methylobacterium sp. WL18]GJE22719.1 Transcriptional activator FeaR [Methylobacterium mesophilicum]